MYVCKTTTGNAGFGVAPLGNAPTVGEAKTQFYSRLYRALREDQKEFVSHPYCQVGIPIIIPTGCNVT